ADPHDFEVSLRGDIDLRDLPEMKIDIFPSVPVFELTNPPNICMSRINLQPVGITLAPMIDQIEFHGGIFEGGWKMTLRRAAIADQSQAIPYQSTNNQLCFVDKPAQQAFIFGLHAKPQPTPPRVRKRERR